MWLSQYVPSVPQKIRNALFLFEGIRGKDESAQYNLSSYSWLSLLWEQTVSSPKSAWHPSVFEPVLLNAVNRAVNERDRLEILSDPAPFLSKQLAEDPLVVLAELGAHILPERCIRTLYRVRGTCRVGFPEIAVTLGYPIYIAETARDTVADCH
jgi:hypothetical protein